MRSAEIEARLQRWAQWLKEGEGAGYPAMSVIHPEWQPPAPGQRPTLKSVKPGDARATHRAVLKLSVRMQNTLVVCYCMNLSLRDQAEKLDCSESTVVSRVDKAHRLLQREFCDKLETL